MNRCPALHPTKQVQCGQPEGHAGRHGNGTLCGTWDEEYIEATDPKNSKILSEKEKGNQG